MKEKIINFIVGVTGGFVSYAFGGWNKALETLVIFMALDYITGIIVAGVFKNSTKTTDGTLKSSIGFKGLCRKGMIILYCIIGHELDITLGIDFVMNAVAIGFIANELLSITENAGLMGVPLPEVITKCISILKNKSRDDIKEG